MFSGRIGMVSREAVLITVSLVTSSVAATDTIESVEKDLIRKQADLKSYTGAVESRSDTDLRQGNKARTESKGTIEWARKGSKVCYRMESKGSNAMTIAGNETKSKITSTVVCDGEFTYAVIESDGRKMATKANADSSQGHDVKTMFDLWRREHDLKLLADEKIDGKDC